MMAATSAWADTEYVIGQRILGIDGVEDGDYVVIEQASTPDFYGYYIKQNGDNGFRWLQGFDQDCIWKVEAVTDGTDYKYYFWNVAGQGYMAGSSRTNATLVSSKSAANIITLQPEDSPNTWHKYNSRNQGWDSYSVALQFTTPLNFSDYYGNNDGMQNAGSNYGLFDYDPSYCHNCQWNLYKAVPSDATYKIGDRKKTLTDLHNGELIYIQAAALSDYYRYFINDKNDGTFVWNGGYDDNFSVWRIIYTGTSNQYYFQNLKTGYYMMAYQDGNDYGKTTSEKSSAGVITIYTLSSGLGNHSYNYMSTLCPRGWDQCSFNLKNGDWFHNDVDHVSSGEIFTRAGAHNAQFNIYTAEIKDNTGEILNPGTAITSVSDIKCNRAYTLTNLGHIDMEVKADNLTAIGTMYKFDNYNTTTGSTEVGFNQWVFVPTGNTADCYYLYNVASKKYIKADGGSNNELTDDEPLTMKVSTVTDNGTTYLQIVPQNNGNRTHFGIYSGDGLVYINGGLGSDGTYLTVAEAAIFEPSAVTDVTVPSFTLVDKVDYTPPTYSFTASTATYTRENLTSKWGTIMLPYDVDANDDVAFYSIDNESGGVLTVTKADKLTAGTPALFKTNGASSVTFSASPATVKPTTQTATGGGLTLVGTYTKETIDVDNTYYIKDDKFYSKGDGINFIVNPFRAYMKSDGSTKSNAFSIVVDDDPTGITAAATSADASDEIEGVYSVNGVKLSDLQKGINIIRYRSGKTQKVILK